MLLLSIIKTVANIRSYNFSKSKAEEIYGKAKELVPVLPKDE